MKDQIISWFSAPIFEGDRAKSWRASLLNTAIHICVFFLILVLAGNLMGGKTPTSVFVIDGIMLLVLFSIRKVLLSGRVSLTGVLLVTFGLGLITATSAELGTIRTPSTAFLMLMVLIAGLTFGKRGLVLSVISSSLAVLGLILAENRGLLPTPDTTVTITQWVSYTVAFALTGMLANLVYQSMQQALGRAFTEIAGRERVEEAYKNLVNNSLQTYAIYQDERVVFVSPQAEQLTGYSCEELYAMPAGGFFSLIIGDEQGERKRVYRERMAGAEYDPRIEMRITRKDGEIRWLESISKIITYQGGPALQAVYLDITTQKQAEEALRLSEARLKEAERIAQIGHWELDIHNNKLYWSDEIYRIFELSPSQVESSYEDFLAIVHPDDRDLVDKTFSTSLETKEPYSIDHRILLKGGRIKYVHQQSETLFDEQGNTIRSLGTIQDITERKQAEEELLDSQQRYRLATAASKTNVWEWNIPGNEIHIDANGFDLGYETDEYPMNVETFHALIHPDDLQTHIEALDAHIAGKTPAYSSEYRVLQKDSSIRWLQAQGKTVRDEQGNPVKVMGTSMDITERKQIEKSEHDQRMLAEALRETAEALNSSLNLDEVLTKILDKVKNVVECDAVSLLWIEEQTFHFMKLRGFGAEQGEWLQQQSFLVKDFHNIQEVLSSGKPVIISDTKSYPYWISFPQTDWIRSHIDIPVIVREKVVAIINLDRKKPGFYTEADARNIQAFASQVAIAVQNAMLFEEIQNLATIDDLTGLYNRRGFFEICCREIGRLQRYQRAISILFVDIDYFKQFNDRYSYEVGDQVLQLVAKTLQHNIREIDIVGRYGGEEMIVLLPEINQIGAVETAERLRKWVGNLRVLTNQGDIGITVSIGVATLAYTGETLPFGNEAQKIALNNLIAEAGEALHIAKRNGRNQVCTL